MFGPFCSFKGCGIVDWTNGPRTVRGLQLSYVEIKQIHRQCEIKKEICSLYCSFVVIVVLLSLL